ncbi:extracellular solute-binding protein [Pseudomonas sp. NC26]|uniref:ABC transporter substrate-binding protein n=1 Tax=Pseudomonas putida TaxID=303 RepID=A0A7W2L6J8_PSEPU|nr:MULTISPECIES: extracellular solute-binding protein [Pseudomonas]MBA6119242.1 ABC transporter substrate-binding protein [Pseudomonas putida]MCZ9639697.1 extracellular solute-binding protein [Pseudomonas putida]MEC4878521.1 extracellular solute-binding protein [Pseudomonas sp. NC26]QNL88310.1 Nickel/peptides/opines ABC transporter substrate-binding protein [Pseudomonas putida]
MTILVGAGLPANTPLQTIPLSRRAASRAFLLPQLLWGLVLLCLGGAAHAAPTHALTVYGEAPRYAESFRHFDYVNANAPKGGILRRSAIEIGQFDHILPYIDKGTGVSQVDGWLYAPLAVRSFDEPYTVYGLIARRMERGPDDAWLRFEIDPRATFADGTPVRAEDVRFTFDTLMNKGSLKYRTQFADVAGVTVEGPRWVRFDFKQPHGRTLPLDLASLPVLPEHDWQGRDFANGAGFDKPVGSGPYRIGRLDNGRSITFERDPNWWARDLPASRGRFNFERIRIEYFGDTEVARQVLKGGGYDYNREFSATAYTLGYNGAQLDDGRLQRAHLGPAKPQIAQGFVFNLDQAPFKDRRVRQALGMLWDFEWSNRQMMRNLYIRQQSVFSNTPLAARNPPDAGELQLLEPLRGQVPDEVFSQVFTAPVTDGSGIIRAQQLQALTLLQQAGWHPDGDRLVNAQGQPLAFTFLNGQSGIERLLLPWKRNLAQIGITLNIRNVDASQYVNRVMARDYDMIVTGYPVTLSPGAELYNYFGSAAANDPGSNNLMVLKDPAVDSLIDGLVRANSEADMLRHAHALDRVLQWNYYWIPNYYPPGTSTVWWNRFGRPRTQPAYDEGLDTWWEVSPEALTNVQMAERQKAAP